MSLKNGLWKVCSICFCHLKQKFDILSKHLFKFFKIKILILKTQKCYVLCPLTSLQDTEINNYSKKGFIYRFHINITNFSQTSSENKSWPWCEDWNCSITVKERRRACLKAQTQNIYTKFKPSQYRLLWENMLLQLCRTDMILISQTAVLNTH